MALPATFFAKHVYNPASLSVAFLTFKSRLFVMFLPLVAFPRYQEITAGGFPFTSRQGIDLSPPTSTSIVLLEAGADGLSGHKKKRKDTDKPLKRANFPQSNHPLQLMRLIEVHYWVYFHVTHNYGKVRWANLLCRTWTADIWNSKHVEHGIWSAECTLTLKN